ncbi:MAG: GAF domain-containing protein [Anaerolineales bacterium]|nr:GAF domain-containing protein [Anaerolineales bacterium]
MPARINYQLKEASRLTEATWSALIEREAGAWRILSHYRLAKKKHLELIQLIGQADTRAKLHNSHDISIATPQPSTFEAARLFIFPLSDLRRALIVGSDRLDANARRLWRLVAAGMQQIESSADASASVAASLLVPDLDSESPYDLPRALDRALASFLRLVSVQGAWLALRRGDSLEVRAQWSAPSCANLDLPIESNTLLRRMNRNLAPMVVNRNDPLWELIPHKGIKASAKVWTCIPIVIGQRMIGTLALWRTSAFKHDEWNRLSELTAQIAPAIETIITFAEMTNHLRRMAMLNDFSLTISTGRNLDQIARRVFALLARALGTELIALDLLSANDQLIAEFRSENGRVVSSTRSLRKSWIASLIQDSQKVRLGSPALKGAAPLYQGALSGLYVPLRFHDQVIGALCVESAKADAFNSYDESLIVVIASHLASLADYTRVREEAEGRARNLGLIHEVVGQVVGLTEPHSVAQITAELLARYFAYDLAAVFIADDQGVLTIRGFGGASRDLVERAVRSFEYPVRNGISGHVFESGESLMINDASQDERYRSIKGWQAGSQMCVAIRDGAKILGVIDVESRLRYAFTHNDFIALESLAGILAGVIASADQYQRLETTVGQLRAAQIELDERMDAQRKAENRLLQAAKLAAVGEMAAGIAHELNNPLTSVTGFAELALEEFSEENQTRKDLELVLREAKRARDVVRRLLDFARQGESARASASLNEVVEDVIALSKHLLHTNGVNLQTRLDESLSWVVMDANQMKQVALNLVHNALQAMPNGGILEIATSQADRDNRQWALLSVRDNGAGISPKDLSRIFEPFFTTRSAHGGTGLGLSVTYGIVTDHGGAIDVDSAPNTGTKFTVWLPL